MLHILNAEPTGYSPDATAILQTLGQVDVREFTRHELLDAIGAYDVILVRLGFQIDREILDAGKKLRAVVSASTGLDHIDLAYAKAQGVAVLSLRGELGFINSLYSTAEHTWGLLLALMRRIPAAFDSIKDGEWNRDAFRGRDLDGRRLGILGLGRIGRRVAQYGNAFGMTVCAYNPRTNDPIHGVTRVSSLPELLAQSDVFSLHAGLNDATRGLIGATELARLPKGAVVVNTARGEIIDQDALVSALESQHLAGAALDVMAHEREPEARNASPLLAYARTHDNLILTPHIGGATYDTMAKSDVFMANKLAAFLIGRPTD